MFGGFVMVWTPIEVRLIGGILANPAGLFTGIALVRRLGLG